MIDCNLQLKRGDFQLDVSAQFGPVITGIYGPSASGKTSLLLSLAGLVRPDSGNISVDGQSLFASDRRLWIPAHRRRLATVFQDDRLFPHRTVAGNLRYAMTPGDHQYYTTVIELLGLAPLLARRIHHLSGGERQRVALGRALLARPRVLLLDEPFSALDSATTSGLVQMLRHVHDLCGLPMIIISHDLRTLLELNACLLILAGGRVRGHGSLSDILARPEAAALLERDRLVNVLPVVVREQRPETHATVLALVTDHGEVGPPLICAPIDAPLGTRLTAILRPQDWAISRDRPERISSRNRLCGTITAIQPFQQRCLITVNCGLPLLCEITRQADEELALEPGQRVWLSAKAAAVETTA